MGKHVILWSLMLLLAISTWQDLRKKELSVIVMGVFGVIGMIIFFFYKQMGILNLAGGVGIGLIVLLAGKCTRGGIGMGDGLLLCITGIYLGFYENMELFLAALMLAAVYGIVLMLLKKAGRKTEIPFAPFLAIAYVGIAIL